MKKLLFVFIIGAFAACGSGSTSAADPASVTSDSSSMSSGSSNGAMSSDSTATGSDTGTMSTPH